MYFYKNLFKLEFNLYLSNDNFVYFKFLTKQSKLNKFAKSNRSFRLFNIVGKRFLFIAGSGRSKLPIINFNLLFLTSRLNHFPSLNINKSLLGYDNSNLFDNKLAIAIKMSDFLNIFFYIFIKLLVEFYKISILLNIVNSFSYCSVAR